MAREGERSGTDFSAAIYGSLLVTTLVAAQARSDASAEFIAFSVIVAAAVFWLAEAWSKLVSLRIAGPVSRGQAARVARAESPMLLAAIPPTLALGLSALGVLTVEQAIDLALIVAIVQLFAWGLLVGRAVGRGWPLALLIAGVDCALGLVIVVLKVIVIH